MTSDVCVPARLSPRKFPAWATLLEPSMSYNPKSPNQPSVCKPHLMQAFASTCVLEDLKITRWNSPLYIKECTDQLCSDEVPCSSRNALSVLIIFFSISSCTRLSWAGFPNAGAMSTERNICFLKRRAHDFERAASISRRESIHYICNYLVVEPLGGPCLWWMNGRVRCQQDLCQT